MSTRVLQHFKRINLLVAAYNAAISAANTVEHDQTGIHADDVSELNAAARAAGDNLLGYESHGHGGKHRTKNRLVGAKWCQSRSMYAPHQGGKECNRRQYVLLPLGAAPVANKYGPVSTTRQARRAEQAEWNARVAVDRRTKWEAKLARRTARNAA